ncbi:MAG: DNA (cytosine-5-)-methyltransferase [Oscillospiraceae bacterium]|nr:DNA (cytosine-5-)-methyltransferase [Oscillospiraceae bacterium]
MKLLSLFDGSGAFPLAAERLGIHARYASEIEPFPIAVTRARFPEMEHLGDITKINGGAIEPCELVTFGSPCTSWSIAGKQAGLDGPSGLFSEAVRVMREMLEATNGEYPKAFLFENVPNLLSINGGADWKIVMDAFADLGFICDPNILDAQEFGIAQRRKRIFVVGINCRYFDPARFAGIPNCRHKRIQKAVDSWGGETFHGITSRPHEIERQHLSEILERDVDPKYYLSATACLGILRRIDAKGKEIPRLLRSALEYQAGLFCADHAENEAYSFEAGAMIRRGGGAWADVAPTLRAETFGGDNHPGVAFSVENHPMDGRVRLDESGMVQTLTSRMGTGGNSAPLCAEPVAYGISSVASHAMNSPNPRSGVYETDTAKTLDTSTQTPCNQGGLVICAADTADTAGGERTYVGEPVFALTTGNYAQSCEEQSPTLTARDFKSPPVVNQGMYCCTNCRSRSFTYIVRRLTPTECLMLMNLPKYWCDDIGVENPTEADFLFWESVFSTLGKKKSRKQIACWLAKPYSDGVCYKMAGNGIVVAVAQWVLGGIVWDTETSIQNHN